MGRTGKEPFDRLEGYQVIARFNKEKDRKLIYHTGHHRGQRSIFEDNIECILEYPIMIKSREI